MTHIDQLLAKALSTTSEEEAIACLRMARKKGTTTTSTAKPAASTSSTSTYGGYTAKEWRDATVRVRAEYDKLAKSYKKLADNYSNLKTLKLEAERQLTEQKQTTKLVIILVVVALLPLGFLLL